MNEKMTPHHEVPLELPTMVWSPSIEEKEKLRSTFEQEAVAFFKNHGVNGAADEDSLSESTKAGSFLEFRKSVRNILHQIMSHEQNVLAHEDTGITNVDIRLETIDTYEETTAQTEHDFHVDTMQRGDENACFYVFAIGLGTIGLTGTMSANNLKAKVTAPARQRQLVTPKEVLDSHAKESPEPGFENTAIASLLPMHLYRLTGEHVHAIPTKESYDDFFKEHPKSFRLFFRIAVSSK